MGETERRRAEHPPAPFLWHSKASSQVLGMGTSFIYFCPPDALCRQRSHLCQGALAGGQTPQSHQIPPKHSPLSQSSPILLFPPFQRTWILRVGPGSAPWAGGCPILCPPQALAGEALLPQHFCSGLGMALGISLPASGNGIERALSLPRKYRSRVLMAFH